MKKNSKLLEAIKKGGSVSNIAVNPDLKPVTFQMRLVPSLISRIDALCEKRKPEYYSRHAWVMAAIMAKLKDEEV